MPEQLERETEELPRCPIISRRTSAQATMREQLERETEEFPRCPIASRRTSAQATMREQLKGETLLSPGKCLVVTLSRSPDSESESESFKFLHTTARPFQLSQGQS
jgi:hypothetical protein